MQQMETVPEKRLPSLRLLLNESVVISRSKKRRKPNLRCLPGGTSVNDLRQPQGRKEPEFTDDYGLALHTIENILSAEDHFIGVIRNKVLESANDPASSPTVFGKAGHDYLIHLAQFLFFLKALDCTEPEQIGRLIDEHNRKIQEDIENGQVVGSVAEKKRAIFKAARKTKVVDTFRHFERPVFSVTELAHFLTDDMSESTAVKLIEELRYGGLLDKRTDQRMEADTTRVLLTSTGFLEGAYATALVNAATGIRGPAPDPDIDDAVN